MARPAIPVAPAPLRPAYARIPDERLAPAAPGSAETTGPRWDRRADPPGYCILEKPPPASGQAPCILALQARVQPAPDGPQNPLEPPAGPPPNGRSVL